MKEYQPTRGLIEDVFTLKKEGLSLKRLHRYTRRSVHKIISIAALLAGIIASLGYSTSQKIQKLTIS